MMRIFLVGGAVRDQLLGLSVVDRDWVVVNSTPEKMISLNFIPVGINFPVFLHPETKEEYALARTEKKSGHGYAGFTFYANESVSLEEDLKRRDFTINAIASTEDGKLIDPFNGLKDIAHKKLRHVSAAFIEDPLRILRAARFLARYHKLGFTIAKETMALMELIVRTGEASYLVAERVWQETFKALQEPNPEIYFTILDACGALNAIMPELKILLTQTDGLKTLIQVTALETSAIVRFASLFINAQHLIMDNPDFIKKMVTYLPMPKVFAKVAKLVLLYGTSISASIKKKRSDAETVFALYESAGAFNQKKYFNYLLKCLWSRSPKTRDAYCKIITNRVVSCLSINAANLQGSGYTGKALGKQLRCLRITQLSKLLELQK